jgi:hypothetical protein
MILNLILLAIALASCIQVFIQMKHYELFQNVTDGNRDRELTRIEIERDYLTIQKTNIQKLEKEKYIEGFEAAKKLYYFDPKNVKVKK